jgi:cysteine desulfurase / selenocysteine lyase
MFDVARIRADFPILATQMRGKPLVYLDNGATTQKPQGVIDAITRYYSSQNANIHRGVYELSQTATDLYETARRKVQKFINAAEPAEVIFTRGTTEAINLVAFSYVRTFLKPGDELIISTLEHHSNIVPWQMACDAIGANLRVIPINDAGELLMDEYTRLLNSKTKFVAVNHISNSLGTINPVDEIIRQAHAVGAKVLIDGAQWVAHYPTDVQALDADFYAFSGHKLYGPTGAGVLYGKRALLEKMPPYQGGGDMIASVTFAKTTYAELPNKFEAGTSNISGVAGLAAAIDYVSAIGLDNAARHEHALLEYATAKLAKISGLRIIGTAKHKASLISFIIENPPLSTLDIGIKLDREGIAVRTGHHCCQPVMERFGISSTARASFAMYNTMEEVDALAAALERIIAGAVSKPVTVPNNGEVSYPKAFAKTPKAAAQQLAEEFEFLGDRTAKNEYVMDLAARLPNLFDMLKKVTPRVPGCMAEVYLVSRRAPQSPDVMEFVADADADIVRGLIAILQRLYSGQKASDILAFDIEAFFRQIELDQFITSQRRNGLEGMVRRIRQEATAIAKPTP